MSKQPFLVKQLRLFEEKLNFTLVVQHQVFTPTAILTDATTSSATFIRTDQRFAIHDPPDIVIRSASTSSHVIRRDYLADHTPVRVAGSTRYSHHRTFPHIGLKIAIIRQFYSFTELAGVSSVTA